MQTFQHFKPLKRFERSEAIERNEVMERFERGAAKHVLSEVEGDAKRM